MLRAKAKTGPQVSAVVVHKFPFFAIPFRVLSVEFDREANQQLQCLLDLPLLALQLLHQQQSCRVGPAYLFLWRRKKRTPFATNAAAATTSKAPLTGGAIEAG